MSTKEEILKEYPGSGCGITEDEFYRVHIIELIRNEETTLEGLQHLNEYSDNQNAELVKALEESREDRLNLLRSIYHGDSIETVSIKRRIDRDESLLAKIKKSV